MPSRRSVLGTCGLGVALLAGCSDPREAPTATRVLNTATSGESPESPTGTTGTAEASPPASTGMRTAPSVYLSEIRPNPEGDDAENPNDEYVLIEMNAEERRDLSDFSLNYGSAYRYGFPDAVSGVESGANLVVRSGRGETHVEGTEYPTYSLFAGSDAPLLDDDGMRLTLWDGRGEPVDSVAYPALDPGAIWARPE